MQLLSFSKKNDINKSVSPVHARLFLYRNQSGESIAVAITLSLAITALLFAVHPLIYGDAIYYALDISQGKSIWTDPGHLLWRPLGFFLHRIISCFAPIDPLTSFQLLSALSVFLLFVSGHLLFLRFYPHSKLGIVFILFIGGNYFFFGALGKRLFLCAKPGCKYLMFLFYYKREDDRRKLIIFALF